MSEAVRKHERAWHDEPSLGRAQAFLHELRRCGREPKLGCIDLARQIYETPLRTGDPTERPLWLDWPAWWPAAGLELRVVESTFWQYDERHLLFCQLEGFPFLLIPHAGDGPLRQLTALSVPGLLEGRADREWLAWIRPRCAADLLGQAVARADAPRPRGWPDLDLTPTLHDSLLALGRSGDEARTRHALAILAMFHRRTGAGSSELRAPQVSFDPAALLDRLADANWSHHWGEERREPLEQAQRTLPVIADAHPPGIVPTADGCRSVAYALVDDDVAGSIGGWSRALLALTLEITADRWELTSRIVWHHADIGLPLS